MSTNGTFGQRPPGDRAQLHDGGLSARRQLHLPLPSRAARRVRDHEEIYRLTYHRRLTHIHNHIPVEFLDRELPGRPVPAPLR